MRETVHIFSKDVWRLAGPIVALVAIEATAAFGEIRNHVGEANGDENFLSDITSSLLPFAWIFLIAAVILQERLPGTRQYWLTRPIGWRKLLAAKLLFVAVFINGIWFLSDCVILACVGAPIHPLDLLMREIPLTAMLFLPAVCLASLTTGLGQMSVSLIAAILGCLVVMIVPSVFFRGLGIAFDSYGLIHFFGRWLWVPLLALTLEAIVLQFARRTASPIRFLLVVPLIVIVPYTFFANISGLVPETLMALEREGKSASGTEIAITFDPTRRPSAAVSGDPFVGLQIPIRIADLPVGDYVEGFGSSQSPESLRDLSAVLFSDAEGRWLRFDFGDKEYLAKAPREPVYFSATVGLSVFRVEKAQRVALGSPSVVALGSGTHCRVSERSQCLCWSGPDQTSSVDYRVLLAFHGGTFELRKDDSSVAYEPPWGFSPIVHWRLSGRTPLNLPPDTQVRFLQVKQIAARGGFLRTGKIDLMQYIVKP